MLLDKKDESFLSGRDSSSVAIGTRSILGDKIYSGHELLS